MTMTAKKNRPNKANGLKEAEDELNRVFAEMPEVSANLDDAEEGDENDVDEDFDDEDDEDFDDEEEDDEDDEDD